MNNRWKMNRIGFVNFWLYDEEDFLFEDGRLLLRGQNGSGKSITTQSFIPFILDGDRTPSRLDPFGSSDRRMEYYFLGEEGKDESTGYLFLEFQKTEEADGEKSVRYRTIGIGQRARRGRPMDFWGFLILDGRRIGQDLWLYKQTGSVKIPYDRRDLKQVLGEENPVTDSPSEYKKLVNQHIFGFRKLEQYEQFIRLLVKVRAPKLSKEFKPTKVYEILNDSLQTLTDEDLRPMVDAMEKMDEIQESLDRLKRAFGDVRIIRTEYTRYNQFMLAKKAQAYLSRKSDVEKAQAQLEAQLAVAQEIREQQRENGERLNARRERERLARAERDSLLDDRLKDMDVRLETARRERQEARERESQWEKKAEDYNGKIFAAERKERELQDELSGREEELQEERAQLQERQEVLQWEGHSDAAVMLEEGRLSGMPEITKRLMEYEKNLAEGKKRIHAFAEASGQYEEAAFALEQVKKERAEQEKKRQLSEKRLQDSQDDWISLLYEKADRAVEWKPERSVLREAEELAREYGSVSDAGEIQELLRRDYEGQRLGLLRLREEKERSRQDGELALKQAREELLAVQNAPELEPERGELIGRSRRAMEEAGIRAVPFYKAVEFADGLEPAACAVMEAQLKSMGLLDALVVRPEDLIRIEKECPEFLDSVICVDEAGNAGAQASKDAADQPFAGLTVNTELEDGLRKETARILRHIRSVRTPGEWLRGGLRDGLSESRPAIGESGFFRQGALLGKAWQEGEAEYVGQLARKRKKEQKIRQLTERISELEALVEGLSGELSVLAGRLDTLEKEYRELPDFSEINDVLEKLRECVLQLELLNGQFSERERKAQEAEQRKNRCWQEMLQSCKALPYGRTEEEYEEAQDALREYEGIWRECRETILRLQQARELLREQQDRLEEDRQALDDALAEKQRCGGRVRECEIRIRQYEEYLNRPEIREKAERLKALNEELEQISKDCQYLEKELAKLEERLLHITEAEPEKKAALQRAIGEETWLRKYFEEELSLKLVFDREAASLPDCAQKALGFLRESDKNREPADMLQSLYQVFQKYNGSLASYGTSLEDCFGMEEAAEQVPGALRKRVRVASVWNGKKVYLEEFYQILKNAIDETQLLIQEKDRELFEDILSQTISQQLTDRIAESRRWVADMSKLMRDMDTSMGLSFSLDWKPRSAENEAELDVTELEQILLRDRSLLTMEDIEKVAAHFRSKIRTQKRLLEETGGMINYMELVREAMDYRGWFSFQMFYRRGEEPRKPLTNAAFNRFSGGEKAMAMYVPLFAAVNAQYQKADRKDHPRIIALDEAFAGVDDKNISSMFELVEKLDFDYIMNSQSLWGCYDTVRGLRIAELLRPMNSQIVTIIRYTWNGHERILDEQ